ncbi:PadR family transcriptional regulator [Micromonospora sp. B11E3]|uniref:PadR family transcriptional regulator n=1 Tax=Micromonospora sp. B11E3 TaxID=3153562 RepID=UPI00325D60E4
MPYPRIRPSARHQASPRAATRSATCAPANGSRSSSRSTARRSDSPSCRTGTVSTDTSLPDQAAPARVDQPAGPAARRLRTAGRPSPGSIYPTLQLLEDEGVIAATDESGGGRKRFTLTEQGRAEAGEAAQAPPWAELAQGTVASWHDIRDAGAQAMHALRQVMMTGTDDQRERAAQVLDETRRKLYAILAESE